MNTSAVATHTESDIPLERLEELYTLRRKEEVVAWLRKYPVLIPFLLDAPKEIRKYYRRNELVLEVVHDPEVDSLTTLWLMIVFRSRVKNAYERLTETVYRWFDTAPRSIHEAMMIGLDFQ